MGKSIHKLIYYITDKIYRNRVNAKFGLYNFLSDEAFLKKMFSIYMGYELNLENPRTFNEKLQWLKLNDRKSIYTTMVDKYTVKNYVASIIGEEYIIPTLGVWDKFDDIDFDALPNQFVLKCTHDSGGLVICKDKSKLDKNAARKKLNRSLKTNYYYRFREWPYKNVTPRIIAEKYMEDHSTSELRDYKFFCFGGMAKCYKVDFDRFVEHRANYFSADGKLMKIGEEICPPDFNKEIPAPENLEKMKELAEKLSATQPFLRADFYDVNGHVYFGELTFYPASGFGKFIFDGNDELLGSWIKLPEKSEMGGYYLIYKDVLCVLNTRAINLEKDISNSSHGLADYKIHSFNGVPKVILVCRDRFSDLGLTEDFFDQNWTHLDVQREMHPNSDTEIEKPRELDKMLELAEKLSKDIPFLRSDFYTIDGKVYFGELTFYPASGFEGFQPASFDRKLGDWVVLPDVGGGTADKR
ncbi:MAG: ATP-grasp fold amidoligase family protein [Oribacterium sp.]|nr:ATP-grasp fold amidoligase family protein [Oribacterium sp.]